MKKLAKLSLALCLCLCMLVGNAGIAFAAPGDGGSGGGAGGFGGGPGGGAGGPEWDDSAVSEALPVSPYDGDWEWVLRTDENGTQYWALDVVYCANPTVVGGKAIQHLAVYAPAAYMREDANGNVTVNPNGKVVSSTGIVYTAETAPILYGNNSGGYGASSVKEVTIGYMEEGLVQVSMETRGKATQDDSGAFIGQLPVIVADLKAGIRFLKANDGVLPGNSQRIVSHGASSGGALSAMLGSTGNSSVFESYLNEIGAADATDDIFMALCYCPITNLSTGDAGFEWFHMGNTQYFVFNAMAVDRLGNAIEGFAVGPKNMHDLGDNVLGGAQEDELSAFLSQWYVGYIQDLGFDLSDDGLSGAYSEGLRDKFIESLETYIARYDELNPDAEQTVEDYLAGIQTEDGWFTYDAETGTVSIDRLTDVVAGFVPRNKICPSLDSYNYKSNEGDSFVTADGEKYHFSQLVLSGLETLLAEYEAGEHQEWTENDVQYVRDLIGDYAEDINEASAEMLEIMSPINYVTGVYDADMAPYFRWQIGTSDGDHGIPAAWLTHNALLREYPEVSSEFNLIWGSGHGAVEYTTQDMYDYISEVMVAEDGLPYNLDAGLNAGDWVYGEADGVGYYALDVVYCASPVLAEAEHLVVYAPAAYMTQNADGTVVLNPKGSIVSSTGVVYTAETAPILFHNTSGGYSSSTIQPVNTAYLREGYVHVSVATRGKETKSVANENTGSYTTDHRGIMDTTKNDEGEYIGQFPAIMVDLKAAIRYLKANDGVLPGNSQRIVSRGYSSGGAVSAMLGASGNSPVFESYLKEIGAADTTDDIFIALASAPITNLSSADASYEWYQFANEEYFLFNAMAFDREGNAIPDFPVGMANFHKLGDNVLGGVHEKELSAKLYAWFVDYVQDLGFDLGDDGRSGAFYEGFAQIYSDSLTEFVARYDELKSLLDGRNYTAPDTVGEYLADIQNEDDPWFTYDADTGVVTIVSLDAFVYNYLNRGKMCPSLDSYNYRSNENNAFTAPDGTTLHFSWVVRDALEQLLAEYEAGGHQEWDADDIAYLTALIGDYNAGISDDSSYMLEVMSPINYIVGSEGFEGASIAPYWRLRVGSSDGDHGAPAAWLIAQGLEKYHPEVGVSVGIAWGMGHSLSELTEQDLYDYISGIMVEEDQLSVNKASFSDVSSGDWYFDAVEYVNETGLMGGVGGKLFAPEANTSGAMLATILARMDGVNTAGGATWYEKGAAWAAENGLSDGIDLAGDITREQVAVMLYRYAQLKGCDVSVGENTNILSYDDVQAVSEAAIPAMQWACGAGVIQGSGNQLNPGASVSRSVLATMLKQFCENVVK